MRLFGETVNLMSMGGLAVAIGLVIDDAVVVVENIHRHLARPRAPAIEKATAELVAPVVGSTLTTVVVFAPLGCSPASSASSSAPCPSRSRCPC